MPQVQALFLFSKYCSSRVSAECLRLPSRFLHLDYRLTSSLSHSVPYSLQQVTFASVLTSPENAAYFRLPSKSYNILYLSALHLVLCSRENKQILAILVGWNSDHFSLCSSGLELYGYFPCPLLEKYSSITILGCYAVDFSSHFCVFLLPVIPILCGLLFIISHSFLTFPVVKNLHLRG